ncbi:MAG: hypothetical protein ACLSHO_09335 [Dysosmobacter sp.]
MLKNIFLDLDDTILNFTAGEAKALSQTLREAGIEPTEAILVPLPHHQYRPLGVAGGRPSHP